MHNRIGKWVYAATGVVLLGAIALALRPAPLPVETQRVSTGPLEVTTEELGETRAHDRFVVAAPIAGHLLRVLLRDGDSVSQGQAVATMAPLPLSARERDELNARIAAAEAMQRGAQAQLSHVVEDLEQARRESSRLEQLFSNHSVSRQQLEQAQNATVTLENEVTAARYRVKSAAADVRGAKAGLAALNVGPKGALVTVRAPSFGRVLRVLEPSERVVAAGTPILIIADLEHLEIVLEMLSSEAVKVAPGMPAVLEGWGGDRTLKARVRLIEPYAFTKISALGVEEKRTRVILDLVDLPGTLGDGYRVTGRIVLWNGPSVRKIPIAALFRCGSQWCVFTVDDARRARRREVQIAHRNASEAEIWSGLREGELVVRHPPNELKDGARVAQRW
ncbi:MAG TPA: efflux RND transporter periplasmic adaptor subunit [Steroidobacteraceae bacterium]